MIDYSIEEKKDVTIIHFYTNLETNVISEAEKVWNMVLEKKPTILALDFTRIEFVDSLGLSHLVKLTKNSIIKDVELIFFGTSASVKSLFAMATLDKFFNIMSKATFENQYLQ